MLLSKLGNQVLRSGGASAMGLFSKKTVSKLLDASSKVLPIVTVSMSNSSSTVVKSPPPGDGSNHSANHKSGSVSVQNFLDRIKPGLPNDRKTDKPKNEPIGPVATPIPYRRMIALTKAKDTARYQLMFATKEGLPMPKFPIRHSAVAFQDPLADEFVVVGRQSPFDFSRWFADGIRFITQRDDEKNYLTKGFRFCAYPTGAYFSKDEMQTILNKADELINQNQFCNMVESNCYSYSVTAFSLAIQGLAARPSFDSEELSRIITVLEDHPLSDHLSLGVLNNQVVKEELQKASDAVAKRLGDIVNQSPVDKKLSAQLFALKQRIKSVDNDSSQILGSLFTP